MSLTNRNKNDLTQYALNIGESDSWDRARKLVADKPEAAQYVNQVKSIAEAFRPPQEKDYPALSKEEIDIIHAAIIKRANTGSIIFRLGQPVKIAAAILIAICGLTWLMYPHIANHSQTNATDIYNFYFVGNMGLGQPLHNKLTTEQNIKTEDTRAVIAYRNGNVAVLADHSSIKTDPDDNNVYMHNGRIFIRAKVKSNLYIGSGNIELQQAEIIAGTDGSSHYINVNTGSVIVKINHSVYQVSAEQRVYWDSKDKIPSIDVHNSILPKWVLRGLDLLESKQSPDK